MSSPGSEQHPRRFGHDTTSTHEARAQRRAALNLMEDAIEARRETESLVEELRASKERLATELEGMRQLQSVSALVGEGGDAQRLYDGIVDAAVAITRADMASMQIVDEDGDTLRLLAFRGFDVQFGRTFQLTRTDTQTCCSVAPRIGARVIVPDVETCDFLVGTETLENLRLVGVRAVQSTPLLSRGGRLLGMISTHWRRPHQPLEDELRVLDVLARQAADLIERRRAEAELRASEARYKAVFESSGVSFWEEDFTAVQAAIERLRTEGVVDFRRYFEEHPEFVAEAMSLVEVVDVNDATVEMFEARDRSELLGSLAMIFSAQSLPAFIEELVAVAEGRTCLQGEALLRTVRGKPLYAVFAMTLPSPPQKLDRVILSVLDISERIRMERQIQAHAAALSDLHRRKDEFLAMLSHELRNPLAPIANAAQLLRLDSEKHSPMTQHARAIIDRQVAQLAHLVDDLLEVSRITAGRVQLRHESIDVRGVAERAVETCQPLFLERRHALSVSMASEPIWVHADAARLEQVLVNLLNNAAKYTDAGGRIEVVVRAEDQSAVMRVRDTGVGIAPELLPRIFDLFTQAQRSLDRSQGGLGIGLALVQRLVELHGGTVEVSSTVGQGSEFVVRLPCTRILAPPPARGERPVEDRRTRRVLVVDDNVDAAESLALLLRSEQHDVRLAHDGRAALDHVLAYRPDAVLLDIGLPELDGFEVARRIRREPSVADATIVALTGYGQEMDQRASQEAGFDHHLVKPADFEKVLQILQSIPEREHPADRRG